MTDIDPPTLEELFLHMKNTAERVFAKYGECLPVFVTLEPPMILPCAFHDLAEKRMKVAMIKALFKETGVKRYGFAFEAWFASEPVRGLAVDIAEVTPPSEREDRKEAIIVVAEEKGMAPLHGMWIIERDRKGRGRLADFSRPDHADELGLFRNMLGTEILN